MSLVASAPGKLVLAGEYAVLEGAQAIVTAVDFRARLATNTTQIDVPPEVRETRALAEEAFGKSDAGFVLDVRALRGETKKLGLGSSAAAAAATVVLVAELAHRGTTAAERFDLALRGHAVIAPRGSGIDVAASVFGGTQLFRSVGGVREVSPVAIPNGARAVVVYTGEEARTSDFVRAVDALSAAARERAMRPLHEAASQCVAAFSANDVRALIDAVRAHHSAMAALGEAASVPIVEANLAAIAARAARFGGAAKPSGAGGGDVAIAVFDDPDAESAFRTATNEAGHPVVEVSLGAPGAMMDVNTHVPLR